RPAARRRAEGRVGGRGAAWGRAWAWVLCGRGPIGADPRGPLTLGTVAIFQVALGSPRAPPAPPAGPRRQPAQGPARAQPRHGRPGTAGRAGAREGADVRLPDRQDPGAFRRGRAQRQAERALPGAAQPGGRGPALERGRAVRRRAAAALLHDHRHGARHPARMGRRLARDPRLRRHRPGGDPTMNSLPRTIPEYLAQLRRALAGADPAMIQDALYDAEEYLRSELAENPGRSEAEVIAA